MLPCPNRKRSLLVRLFTVASFANRTLSLLHTRTHTRREMWKHLFKYLRQIQLNFQCVLKSTSKVTESLSVCPSIHICLSVRPHSVHTIYVYTDHIYIFPIQDNVLQPKGDLANQFKPVVPWPHVEGVEVDLNSIRLKNGETHFSWPGVTVGQVYVSTVTKC